MAKKDKKGSWNQYGSPYDPSFSGKVPPNFRDMAPERQDMEMRRFQVRGCGDPFCGECNPETANDPALRGSLTDDQRRRIMEETQRAPGNRWQFAQPPGGTVTGRNREADIARQLGGIFDRTMMERLLRGGGGIFEMQIEDPQDKAYDEAREQVEQWIITAPEQTFADIIGNEEALELLKDAIEAPVKHKKLYKAYGMRMPKGALLSGPPGCGKTMFARAAASEMKKLYKKSHEFISLSGSELQTMYVGQTEARIKAIFNFAKLYQKKHGHPLLVFIDEAEVILPDRTGRVRRVAPWEESQVATFLAEMDGIEDSGAFVLLASNRPEVIDQAVLRDGRCDFKITIKRPTVEALEVIIEKNFNGVFIQGDLKELVFAAVESLLDPHKVLIEFHALQLNIEKHEIKDLASKHFSLEHIVSGAMAASIPRRAVRYAFARDKESGEATGVSVADVVKAVDDIYRENKNLEHAFALEEFKAEFQKEVDAAHKNSSNDTKH